MMDKNREIKVTPELLKGQAKVYAQAEQMVNQAKQKVEKANGEMMHIWGGKAFDAYLQQYNELSDHINDFKTLLLSINKQLDNYAETQAARDFADQKAFGLKKM